MASKRGGSVLSYQYRKAKNLVDKISFSDYTGKKTFIPESVKEKDKNIQLLLSKCIYSMWFQQARDYHLLEKPKQEITIVPKTYHQKTERRKELARAIYIAAENLQSSGVSPEPVLDPINKMDTKKQSQGNQKVAGNPHSHTGCSQSEPESLGQTVVMHCPHVQQCEHPCCTVHLHKPSECSENPTPVALKGSKCTRNPMDPIECECHQDHRDDK